MAVIMVAMLAFGGTYAYFTATADSFKTGTVNTATLALASSGETTLTINENTDVVPGAWLFGSKTGDAYTYETVEFISTSSAASYVFVVFETTALKAETPVTLKNGTSILESAVDSTKGWQTATVDSQTVYYKEVAAIDENNESYGLEFGFALQFSDKVQANNDQTGEDKFNTNVDPMGISVSVNIKAAAIQKLGYEITEENKDTAVKAAFEAAFKGLDATEDYDNVREPAAN